MSSNPKPKKEVKTCINHLTSVVHFWDVLQILHEVDCRKDTAFSVWDNFDNATSSTARPPLQGKPPKSLGFLLEEPFRFLAVRRLRRKTHTQTNKMSKRFLNALALHRQQHAAHYGGTYHSQRTACSFVLDASASSATHPYFEVQA